MGGSDHSGGGDCTPAVALPLGSLVGRLPAPWRCCLERSRSTGAPRSESTSALDRYRFGRCRVPRGLQASRSQIVDTARGFAGARAGGARRCGRPGRGAHVGPAGGASPRDSDDSRALLRQARDRRWKVEAGGRAGAVLDRSRPRPAPLSKAGAWCPRGRQRVRRSFGPHQRSGFLLNGVVVTFGQASPEDAGEPPPEARLRSNAINCGRARHTDRKC
jgi:hypothetical protein